MGELRESILKQQLQREVDAARTLEAQGKSKEAVAHYRTAASIHRRLAEASPARHSARRTEKMEAAEGVSKETVDGMIIREKPKVRWEDIGGLDEAKREVREAVILPMIEGKPDFVEIPKTILLYGPPGTGKTLLAKAASSNLDAMFFEAKTSSLLSKFYGESEKIISGLFDKARKNQPSIIFMDEFDAISLSRDSGLHEASRRVMSQLLTEMDGFSTKRGEKVIIIAATNRPWDLDDAVISRFQRKIYVPLPDAGARKRIFEMHLKGSKLSGVTTEGVTDMSDGYSGRDIASVCREAIMCMIREQNPGLEELGPSQVAKYSMVYRPLSSKDFAYAFSKVKRTVNAKMSGRYEEWKENAGS